MVCGPQRPSCLEMKFPDSKTFLNHIETPLQDSPKLYTYASDSPSEHFGTMPALVRIFDPYAIALSLLVGLVGFGMNFFFNTNISSWGMNEIGYPAMAMGYVYLRNARFFETDEETGDKLFDKGTGEKATAGSGVTGQKVRAPPVDVPGLSLVAGPALTAPDEGALAVIFFFATWCTNCKRCLPAILALAERYKQEGVTFAGVTKETEDDLRFFVETYHRPVKSTTLLSDGNGTLTAGYQGAYGVKTIPHCYLIRGGADGVPGEIEWHGHPTQLETALGYFIDSSEEGEPTTQEDKEGESAGAGGN